MPLAVAPSPSDAHGETNMVFINPTSNTTGKPLSYINVNGYVLRIQEDPAVAPGTICFNFIHRKICRVTPNGDTIDLVSCTKPSILPTTDAVALIFKLEVEHFSAARKGGIIDYTLFTEFVKRQFENQFITDGQSLLVVVDGNKYIATVREPTIIRAEDGGSSAAATISKSNKDAQKNHSDDKFGLITRATNIRLVSTEKAAIQLTNIPEKQQDMDQAEVVRDFDLEKLGIGGLKKEFGQIFRRAFASRIFPQSIVKKLGIKHTKGVLLYGPPGTGKTLIARKIGQILNCAPPKIVNGPEVFTKWVGGAEENIRKLFAEAEAEQAAKGDLSQIHLIIFDEFDAIVKQRGSTGDNTGVGDNVVNQLLSKIDGVESLNNVLLIGMTNRKDRIDEAVLRPGRFEVLIEIGLPDEGGREEILRIHTHGMRDTNVLNKDVDLAELAHVTKNFSGAEIEGLVRAAQSHAFTRHIDFDNPTKVERPDEIFICMHDFTEALKDVKPAFGTATDECKSAQRHGIIDFGPTWQNLKRRVTEMVKQLRLSKLSSMSILISGEVGSGKSSLAAFTALTSEFPYVKFISAAPLVGYSELNKCNVLRKAFDDAYKSPLSVVVLDDIERLIELSQGGARYSNTLLQTLLVLTKAPPPEGKKLLVLGTTSARSTLDTLEITSCFSAEIEAPLIPPSALSLVSRGLGVVWHTAREEKLAEECLPEEGVPIKKLILMIEMATGNQDDSPSSSSASGREETEGGRTVTFERFSEARLQLGFSS